MQQNNDDWFIDKIDEQEYSYSFKEYDITSSPNDFNIKTIFDFIESGVVKIPGFQRNYVWDINRASKLIESLVIGLPIPQIFLFEEDRNSFLVIDGQQRLMTIYYFMKQRFPRKDKRIELRSIFDEQGKIPDEILHSNDYFSEFNLRLPEKLPEMPNRLNKLNYSTLDSFRTSFDLRTIRNVIIKQNFPKNDDSAVYEIFNRLNSGGVNLKAQEIRSSIYHSKFYEMLYKVNMDPQWRSLINRTNPDLHLKDIEIILRGFAMLIDGEKYKPSMTKFLNKFSFRAKRFGASEINYLENIFKSFIQEAQKFGKTAFLSSRNRINISAYEAIFKVLTEGAFQSKSLTIKSANPHNLENLYTDPAFIEATQTGTARASNVKTRIDRARAIL